MTKDRLTVSRGRITVRGDRPTNGAAPDQLADQQVALHPLSVLAIASSTRLDDPRLEQERVILLGVAIGAGREAARALDRWLSQSLAEYRGSRTAWDLEATTAELRIRLDQYAETLRETAERLVVLIPGLYQRDSSLAASAPPNRRGRRLLDEIAAASGLLGAIDTAPVHRGVTTTAAG